MSYTREQEEKLGLVYSASQVKTVSRCARRWAFDKLDKLPRKQTKATALGSAVHKQLEDYLTTGYMDLTTEEGKIAVSGLHLNPPPGWPHMKVEGYFEIRINGHLFRGYKDVEILTPGGVPYVQDHKTTSNFRWAISEEDLPRDPQAALYALSAMVKTGQGKCDLAWVYYKTRGAKESKKVHLRVAASDIAPTVQQCSQAADYMRACRLTPNLKAVQLPPNRDACGDYGGCRFLELCTDINYERYL